MKNFKILAEKFQNGKFTNFRLGCYFMLWKESEQYLIKGNLLCFLFVWLKQKE